MALRRHLPHQDLDLRPADVLCADGQLGSREVRRIRRVRQAPNLARVKGGEVEERDDERAGHSDPLFEGQVGVRLGQQAEAISQALVVAAEPRLMAERVPAAGRVEPLVSRQIAVVPHRPFRRQRGGDLRQPALAREGRDGRVGPGV